MRNLSLLILLLTLVTAADLPEAFAGKSVGNGGNIVRCLRDGQVSVELLDIYEAKALDPNWNFGTSSGQRTLSSKIEALLTSLARFSPARAKLYREEVKRLLSTATFIDGPVPSLRDSGKFAVPIPRHCEVLQAAVQVPDALNPRTRRLLISKDAYESLDLNQKAALVLHEVLTAEAIQWGMVESSRLRPLTAALVSSSVESMTTAEFLRLLVGAGILTYEGNGLALSFVDETGLIVRPLFDASHRIREAITIFGLQLKLNGTSYSLKGRVKFYDNGNVSQATLASRVDTLFGSNEITLPAGSVLFFSKTRRLMKAIFSYQEVGQGRISTSVTTTWKLNPKTDQVQVEILRSVN